MRFFKKLNLGVVIALFFLFLFGCQDVKKFDAEITKYEKLDKEAKEEKDKWKPVEIKNNTFSGEDSTTFRITIKLKVSLKDKETVNLECSPNGWGRKEVRIEKPPVGPAGPEVEIHIIVHIPALEPGEIDKKTKGRKIPVKLTVVVVDASGMDIIGESNPIEINIDSQ